MSTFKIITYPAAILRKKASPIQNISLEQREILRKMADTMYKDEITVGLAAQQVNLDTQLIVVDVRDKHGLLKLINPLIKEKEGKEVMEEGCKSLPDVTVAVPRAKKIKIEAKSERGEKISLELEGFIARVFQHEIDHLNGRLIIDYLNPIQKLLFRFKYYLKRLIKR